MITTLSKKIVYFLVSASNNNIESSQVEVYIYGLECLLNTGSTILILFVWGLLTNTFLETFCWISAFSILRHHAGGLHAPTQLSCIVSSCLLGISNWLIQNYTSYHVTGAFIACLFCILVCMLFAPTDTSKYELTESMRKKENLYSVSVLMIGFVIAFILKNEISISILYSDVCVCVLLLIKVIIRKLKS